MVGKAGAAGGEDALQINATSGTVTLSGDAELQKEEGGIPAGLTRFQPVVPALPMTQITTAGKGEEMLNILVNDSSFSTNQDKKKKKKGKKGGKSKQPKVAKEMGFTAEEILQMKDEEKRAKSKPKIRPVVYFKDFERRFDDLLTKNKTPRAPTFDSISTNASGRRATEKPRPRQKLGGPGYDDVIPQDKPAKKTVKPAEKERPPTPVFFEKYPPPEKDTKKKKSGSLKKRTQSTQEENVNLLLSILHCRDKDKTKKALKPPTKPKPGKRSVSGSTKKVGGLRARKKMSSMSKSRMTMSQASSRRSSASREPKFDQTLSSVHSSTDRTPAKQTIGAESDASASIVASPEAIKSHDSTGMGSIMERDSTNLSARSKKSRSPAKHSLSPGSSLKHRLNALMQSPNISVHETNVRHYKCHAGPSGSCPHEHTHRTGAANRHVCKDCGTEHIGPI